MYCLDQCVCVVTLRDMVAVVRLWGDGEGEWGRVGGGEDCIWVLLLSVSLLPLKVCCCLCLVSPHDSFPVMKDVGLCILGHTCTLVAWDGCPCEIGRWVAYGPCGRCPGFLLVGVVDYDGVLAFCVAQVGGGVERCCFKDP